MKIIVNGQMHEIGASSLDAVLVELGYGEAVVATALNGLFVPQAARDLQELRDGDCVEVVAPMQGG
jgi:sulfur carrier protein